ncbi:hypothetical protein EXW55_29085 (plasmid) [Bacillus mycoides]|nr:hypothetical protein EXW55_29085 [Bacillus mycoides]
MGVVQSGRFESYMLYLLTLIAPHFLAFFLIVYKISRLTPTDIHLPPKISVSHLHIFEEGVFCRKMIKCTLLIRFCYLDN